MLIHNDQEVTVKMKIIFCQKEEAQNWIKYNVKQIYKLLYFLLVLLHIY